MPLGSFGTVIGGGVSGANLTISKTAVPASSTGVVAQLVTNLASPTFGESPDVANISVNPATGEVSLATALGIAGTRVLNATATGTYGGQTMTIGIQFTLTGVAVGLPLNTLILGTVTLTDTMAPGAVVASFTGKTAGSTITMSGPAFSSGKLAVSGTNVIVGVAGPLTALDTTGPWDLDETASGYIPKTTSFSSIGVTAGANVVSVTLAGLNAAIAAAGDGDIINVQLGAPATLTFSGLVKGGTYGVYIVFDPAQIVRMTVRTDTEGLHFYGGIMAGDIVAGNVTGANYSLNMNINDGHPPSRCSWNGVKFDRGYMGGVIGPGVTDLQFNNCTLEYHRNDAFQIISAQRIEFNDCKSGAVAKGQKTCWFEDGRVPVLGISGSACSALGGHWEDTLHNDVVQSRTGTTDLVHNRWSIQTEGAGLTSFGTQAADSTTVRRVSIKGCDIKVTDTNGIVMWGSDITLFDNVVAAHPDGASGQVAINISRNNAVVGTAALSVARNTAEAYIQPAGVNLTSPTPNPDVVVLPDSPLITRASWAPAMPARPPLSPTNIVPEGVNPPSIRAKAPISTNTWLSCHLGSWIALNGGTFAYQWYRDGVAIAGATTAVYKVLSGDLTKSIRVGVVCTNSFGPSLEVMSAAVVPVSLVTPLAAITGETVTGGVHLGFDNSLGFDTVSARTVSLPAGAMKMSNSSDWAQLFQLETGASANGSNNTREAWATKGTSSSLTPGAGGAVFFRVMQSRNLFISRRTLNVNGTSSFFPSDTVGSGQDTGIKLEDYKRYLIAIMQVGDLPTVKVIDLDNPATVMTYQGTDNRSAATQPNFYRDSTGALRAVANYDNLITDLGGWVTGATARQAWAGGIGGVASFPARSFTNAELTSIASGEASIGSFTGLNYWNAMPFVPGSTSMPAQTVDGGGNAIPITGAATVNIAGTLLTGKPARPTGPFRIGSLIKLQREVGPYTFPLMPGRPTGRVWFDGVNNAPPGYAIYGRLRLLSDPATDFLAPTMLTVAHAGGAFRFTVDGIPKETAFMRSVWVGPAASTPFGPDGHTYDERTPMKIAIRGLYLHQSQGSKSYDNSDSLGGSAGGTGGTWVVTPPANGWALLRYPNNQTTTATAPSPTTINTNNGPRELSITGIVGNGAAARANRAMVATGLSYDEIMGARAGHSLDAFVFDRTAQTTSVTTGTGTARTIKLDVFSAGVPGATSSPTMKGVEPGSVTVRWGGGTYSITDAANAAFTGTQLLTANVQTFPAGSSGGISVTGTINYGDGTLALTFSSDPGAVTASWTTRYDSTDATQGTETTPDKYTLWGSTGTNGQLRRIIAQQTPRHGFSFIWWGGATSNVTDFVQGSESGYLTARGIYGLKMDLLIARAWELSDGTNPPLIVGPYMRSSGYNENNNMRRARSELVAMKPYGLSPATDGDSGATIDNYRWFGGFTSNTLQANGGEHQDSQDTGGALIGEMEGWGIASLMLGDQDLARGPEFRTARIKAGAPNTIEVIPTFFRPGATALTVDTARGGNVSTLYDWEVAINPTSIGDLSAEPLSAARLNTTTGYVELVRASGSWPAVPGNTLRIRHKAYGIMMEANLGGQTYRAADEAKLATALQDNSGGFSGVKAGAETLPVFGLIVT